MTSSCATCTALQQLIGEMRDCAAAWIADTDTLHARGLGRCVNTWCDRLGSFIARGQEVPASGATGSIAATNETAASVFGAMQTGFIPKRACEGAATIDDGDMRECPHQDCRVRVAHDLVDHSFFGFKASCPMKKGRSGTGDGNQPPSNSAVDPQTDRTSSGSTRDPGSCPSCVSLQSAKEIAERERDDWKKENGRISLLYASQEHRLREAERALASLKEALKCLDDDRVMAVAVEAQAHYDCTAAVLKVIAGASVSLPTGPEDPAK